MKKRILAMILSALLTANISACVQVSNNDIEHSVEKNTSEFTDTHSIEEPNQNNNSNKFENTSDTDQKKENNQTVKNNPNLSLSEYQEKLGCYVTTESSDNVKQLMSKDQAKINVEHEDYGSNIFYITTLQENTEHKTTISLSKGVRVSDIYCGFTSEQNGYVMIFHLEGHSVSPMDDIELACILQTADGGKTWDKNEYSDFRVSNGREYISAACFFTENVGFFTARYTNTDHFGPRTYWTVDGGKTWNKMPRLPVPNALEPFGLKGADFSTEISDVEFVNGMYLLTVRICQGYSVKIDQKQQGIYIQYSSIDLVDWTLVK